jgi:hypothetical protein
MDKFNVTIPDYIPTVTEQDIKNRSFIRYFMSKANQTNSIVHEVSQRRYDELIPEPFVVGGFLNWVIVGKMDDYTINVYTGAPPNGTEDIKIPGVLTQNRGSVIFLSRKLPMVENFLTKYDQFYVGE